MSTLVGESHLLPSITMQFYSHSSSLWLSEARAWSTRLANGASRLKPPTVAWPFLKKQRNQQKWEVSVFFDDVPSGKRTWTVFNSQLL